GRRLPAGGRVRAGTRLPQPGCQCDIRRDRDRLLVPGFHVQAAEPACVTVLVRATGRRRGAPADPHYHLLRSSRSFRKTVRGSGLSGRSGNASRSRAITLGLRRRKNVLISPSTSRVVTYGRLGSWPLTRASIAFACSLSGSRSSVKRRLFSM